MEPTSNVILAVDAGVSTGWVLAKVEDNETVTILDFGQAVEADYVNHVINLLHLLEPYKNVTVVAERFDLRPSNKFNADLTTVFINAGLQTVSRLQRPEDHLVWQTPAQAKGLVKNETLKALGWYPTGKDVNYKDANDVRDAFRHLVYYLVVTRKNKWVILQGWPK